MERVVAAAPFVQPLLRIATRGGLEPSNAGSATSAPPWCGTRKTSIGPSLSVGQSNEFNGGPDRSPTSRKRNLPKSNRNPADRRFSEFAGGNSGLTHDAFFCPP